MLCFSSWFILYARHCYVLLDGEPTNGMLLHHETQLQLVSTSRMTLELNINIFYGLSKQTKDSVLISLLSKDG